MLFKNLINNVWEIVVALFAFSIEQTTKHTPALSLFIHQEEENVFVKATQIVMQSDVKDGNYEIFV